FQYIGEVDSAVAWFERGMVLATQLRDTSMLESLTTNFAIIYETKGDYNKSLSYLEKSLSYVDSAGFDAANIYANAASIYYYKGQMSRAVENYEKAIEIFKNTGAEKEYAMTLLNFSMVLADEKLFAK